MKKIRQTFLYSLIGASGGLAGVTALSRCGGGSCTSCFGCAGAGLAVLLTVLISGFKKKEVKTDGKL